MAYGTPADPVAGTVITVAYAVANLLDPIRWLRQMTGNADPPGSNYWLRSTSTTAVTWADRATEVLAAIGYTPVNKAGDTITGNLTFSDDQEGVILSGGGKLIDVGSLATVLRMLSNRLILTNVAGSTVYFDLDTGNLTIEQNNKFLKQKDTGATARNLIGMDGSNEVNVGNAAQALRFLSSTHPTINGNTVWYSANDGAGSGLDADLLDGVNGTSFARVDAATNFTTAPTISSQTVWHAGNDGSGSGLDADLVDGQHASAFAVTSRGVPDGAVVWFETLAELTAAGAAWTRYTAADGRLLVGAGSSASSQTFTQATNYGSTWTPAAGVSVGNGTLAVSDTVSWTSSAVDVTGTGSTFASFATPTAPVAHPNHTHPAPTLSKSGSVSLTGSVSASGTSTVWLPYMRAGIWGKKI